MRYIICQQRRPLSCYQKWLMIARLLDALERDYREVYPEDENKPFPEGFEESLIRMIIK